MNTENTNNKDNDALGILLIFLSLGGIFNFIIFYILGARGKYKTSTLLGHFYLVGFVLLSLFEVFDKILHPLILFVYCILIIASYIIGFLAICVCSYDAYKRLSFFKYLDDFTVKNKDFYAMSNEELKNFVIEQNPQALKDAVSSITAENTSLNENDSLEVKTQVSDKPKISINTIKYEELSALPFFNSSFAEEAVENLRQTGHAHLLHRHTVAENADSVDTLCFQLFNHRSLVSQIAPHPFVAVKKNARCRSSADAKITLVFR